MDILTELVQRLRQTLILIYYGILFKISTGIIETRLEIEICSNNTIFLKKIVYMVLDRKIFGLVTSAQILLGF